MERRETLRKGKKGLGKLPRSHSSFLSLVLAADSSTDLWTECQHGPCRYSKLMGRFSYLTLPARDLLAQQKEKAKALCRGEAAKRCKVAGRCGCSTGMVTVGGGFQPVHLSCPRTRMVIQRSRVCVKWQIGGRVQVMRHKYMSWKHSALRYGDSDQIKIGDFFSLSSLLPSFLPPYFPSFLLSFQPFFLHPIDIHKVHILGLL